MPPPPEDPTPPAPPVPQPTDDAHDAATLAGRKVVVALTGGIACYKTATLVSRLVQAKADVRVLMTESATRFITPLTLQSLSGQTVLTSIWQADDRPDSQHIGVARWCDAMVIAPASANTVARLAHGLCDDVVTLVASALPRTPGSPRPTPLLLAPAMNADMWANPATQRNLDQLRADGVRFVGPTDGWQACRTKGPGRMSEPGAILAALAAALTHDPARGRQARP